MLGFRYPAGFLILLGLRRTTADLRRIVTHEVGWKNLLDPGTPGSGSPIVAEEHWAPKCLGGNPQGRLIGQKPCVTAAQGRHCAPSVHISKRTSLSAEIHRDAVCIVFNS